MDKKRYEGDSHSSTRNHYIKRPRKSTEPTHYTWVGDLRGRMKEDKDGKGDRELDGNGFHGEAGGVFSVNNG